MDDDLAQAVDLGEALLAGGDYAQDFADRLVRWARENGRGIGITTGDVIYELSTGKPLPEPARIVYERRNRIAPNGGVMRCAPVAIARRNDPALLVADSAVTCAVTHYAETCQWSCILVNATIAALLNGSQPDLPGLIAAARADGCPDLSAQANHDGMPSDTLDALEQGAQPPPDIEWLKRGHRLIGHTLLALQFGLWAASTPFLFEDALVASVAAGGDTDTNAAVAGAVLGARYGASSIPERWLACIPQRAAGRAGRWITGYERRLGKRRGCVKRPFDLRGQLNGNEATAGKQVFFFSLVDDADPVECCRVIVGQGSVDFADLQRNRPIPIVDANDVFCGHSATRLQLDCPQNDKRTKRRGSFYPKYSPSSSRLRSSQATFSAMRSSAWRMVRSAAGVGWASKNASTSSRCSLVVK